MRDIRNIIAGDPDWGDGYNFVPIFESDSYGREQPGYLISRDGFVLLAMGYTGEKAMRFKKAYIAAFNKLERKIQAPALPVTYKEALIALVAKVEENERLESRNAVLQITASKYEAQTDTVGLYKTGEIAKELGISAKRLNDFLHDCLVQYKPNGSQTWQLYTDYARDNIAVTQLVRLDNGFDMPMLLWTPKGCDFIFDLAERERPRWYA
jgi:Rha family phage regulatory protein